MALVFCFSFSKLTQPFLALNQVLCFDIQFLCSTKAMWLVIQQLQSLQFFWYFTCAPDSFFSQIIGVHSTYLSKFGFNFLSGKKFLQAKSFPGLRWGSNPCPFRSATSLRHKDLASFTTFLVSESFMLIVGSFFNPHQNSGAIKIMLNITRTTILNDKIFTVFK